MRDNNVIEGAKDSTQGSGGKVVEGGDKTQPGLTSPGANSADNNNVLEGAKATEGRAASPTDDGEKNTQPNITAPGSDSEKRDDNRLPK